jgi:hypothetical protein
VVGILGLALESLGSWVAAQYSDWQQLLRHCKWGDTSTTDDVMDRLSDHNGFGYNGALSKLKNDIAAQHKAIDFLLWHYEPEFELRNPRQDLRLIRPEGGTPASHIAFKEVWLKIKPPAGLGMAQWKILVQGTRHGRVFTTYGFQASEEGLTHDDISVGTPIHIETFWSPHDDLVASDLHASGTIEMTAFVELDVYGDGQHVLARTVKLRHSF